MEEIRERNEERGENAEAHYAVVIIYQGADGTTSVLETIDFTAEAAE